MKILERNRNMSDEVVIEVKVPSSIGATPTANICNVKFGFDWDKGKVILEPEEPLVKADIDRLKQIRELAEENAKLKYEIKNLQKGIEWMQESFHTF
jgi:ERCC4-related helicase